MCISSKAYCIFMQEASTKGLLSLSAFLQIKNFDLTYSGSVWIKIKTDKSKIEADRPFFKVKAFVLFKDHNLDMIISKLDTYVCCSEIEFSSKII